MCFSNSVSQTSLISRVAWRAVISGIRRGSGMILAWSIRLLSQSVVTECCQEQRLVVYSWKHLAPCVALGHKWTKATGKLGDEHSLPKDPFRNQEGLSKCCELQYWLISTMTWAHTVGWASVLGAGDIQPWTRRLIFMEALITGRDQANYFIYLFSF